jgi:hypothetical protein
MAFSWTNNTCHGEFFSIHKIHVPQFDISHTTLPQKYQIIMTRKSKLTTRLIHHTAEKLMTTTATRPCHFSEYMYHMLTCMICHLARSSTLAPRNTKWLRKLNDGRKMDDDKQQPHDPVTSGFIRIWVRGMFNSTHLMYYYGWIWMFKRNYLCN